jgi:hypothetical protein
MGILQSSSESQMLAVLGVIFMLKGHVIFDFFGAYIQFDAFSS